MRGRSLWAAGLAVIATSAALAKPGTPGPAWFSGSYERIGRGGGDLGIAVDDLVVIVPVGQSVAIRGCTGPEVLMGFGPAFELENLMTGNNGRVGVDCLFHNNGYNRPILTCRAGDGGAFTLWPLTAEALAAPPGCGG